MISSVSGILGLKQWYVAKVDDSWTALVTGSHGAKEIIIDDSWTVFDHIDSTITMKTSDVVEFRQMRCRGEFFTVDGHGDPGDNTNFKVTNAMVFEINEKLFYNDLF